MNSSSSKRYILLLSKRVNESEWRRGKNLFEKCERVDERQ